MTVLEVADLPTMIVLKQGGQELPGPEQGYLRQVVAGSRLDMFIIIHEDDYWRLDFDKSTQGHTLQLGGLATTTMWLIVRCEHDDY